VRSKRALYNALAMIFGQLVTILCGLVVPKISIEYFGSNIYGMLVSIGSVMSIIALGEAGVGGVIRAAYYKPLAENDNKKLSAVWMSARKYFTVLAFIFIPYMIGVTAYFTHTVGFEINKGMVIAFCLIVSVQYFMQYFYSLPNMLLIYAAQKNYIPTLANAIVALLNMGIIVAMVRINAEIVLIKAVSISVYMLTPIYIGMYIARHYQLDHRIAPDKTALAQKWDGLGHHIAYYINNNIDVLTLTFLSASTMVSIYSVYHFVVASLSQIISTVTNGADAAFGDMIAKNEEDALRRNLAIYETMVFGISSVLFSVAILTLIPFIKLYTSNFENSAYINPTFGFILLASQVANTIRIPYHYIITAAGHFRQTKKYAYAEAILNVVVSVVLVFKLGIVGVAIGTLVAMTYRTACYIGYLENNLIYRSPWIAIRKIIIMVTTITIIMGIARFVPVFNITKFIHWTLAAMIYTLIAIFITLVSTFVFSKKDLMGMVNIVKRLLARKKIQRGQH
jgi:O-antigen/teichoic acid export membrane protein